MDEKAEVEETDSANAEKVAVKPKPGPVLDKVSTVIATVLTALIFLAIFAGIVFALWFVGNFVWDLLGLMWNCITSIFGDSSNSYEDCYKRHSDNIVLYRLCIQG